MPIPDCPPQLITVKDTPSLDTKAVISAATQPEKGGFKQGCPIRRLIRLDFVPSYREIRIMTSHRVQDILDTSINQIA